MWLYGDWLALNVWESNVLAREGGLSLLALVGEGRGLEYSFWGLFGWFNVPYPSWVYALFRGVEVAALGGLLVRGARHWGRRTVRRPALTRWLGAGVLVAWLLLLGAAWLAFMRVTFAAQGRLFFPALPSVALLLGVGLGAWRWRGGQPWLAWAVTGGLIGLSALTPWLLLYPAYAPSTPLEGVPDGVRPLAVHFDGTMRLEGYTLDSEQVAPGDLLAVTLYWRATAPLAERYSVSLKLFGAGQQVVASSDAYPDGGAGPPPPGPLAR